MTSNTIEFVLDNKIHSISNPDPNETILNYVRLNLKKNGTKEGCAEGGCGACTIVLGELINNNIQYKAINDCIAFLPILILAARVTPKGVEATVYASLISISNFSERAYPNPM